MEAVWPVTALYFGPVASWAYRRYGRPASPQWRKEHGEQLDRPQWVPVALSVSHCGAGCTLGDIVGETAVFLLGVTIAGVALWPEFMVDFIRRGIKEAM